MKNEPKTSLGALTQEVRESLELTDTGLPFQNLNFKTCWLLFSSRHIDLRYPQNRQAQLHVICPHACWKPRVGNRRVRAREPEYDILQREILRLTTGVSIYHMALVKFPKLVRDMACLPLFTSLDFCR